MTATTLTGTSVHTGEDGRPWTRPAPRLTWRRRRLAWRIAWEWTHGGLEDQVETYNRWWQWRNSQEGEP